MDEASYVKGCGAKVVLESPHGLQIEQSLRFVFKMSNNQVEYEALIGQINGIFQVKDP